jgi:hypothetical protein
MGEKVSAANEPNTRGQRSSVYCHLHHSTGRVCDVPSLMVMSAKCRSRRRGESWAIARALCAPETESRVAEMPRLTPVRLDRGVETEGESPRVRS